MSSTTGKDERRVLVTGGSKGIGQAAAEALARRGWSVTLVARDQASLEAARAGLLGNGHRALSLDVADDEGWQRLSNELDGVHGLVCAAAVIGPIGPIGSYSLSDFRQTLDINVLGTMNAIRACLPSLSANGGAIVTFSGGGATAPLPRFDAYAASKAAVVRLTENMSGTLAEEGVRINCVAPGFVATDIHKSTLAAGPELAGGDYYQRTLDELSQGGVPASEAAELVCMLLEGGTDATFTGKLISAQWDPWREDSFSLRLSEQAVLATLRRIDNQLFTTAEKRASA